MKIYSLLLKNRIFKELNKKRKSYVKRKKIEKIFHTKERLETEIVNERFQETIIEQDLRVALHIVEKCLVKNKFHIINNSSFYFDMLSKSRLLLTKYEYNSDNNIFYEVLSSINASNEFAKQNNLDFEKVMIATKEFMSQFDFKDIENYQSVKILSIKRDELLRYNNYDEFIRSRHSIREYKDEQIDKDMINRIVERALFCPSACNRQPCKVYSVISHEKVCALQDSIVDKMFSKEIPNFLVVTSNVSAFNPVTEAFQEYINGGIFINSLVNSIHSAGMGSCLFQTPEGTLSYKKISDIIGLPENEVIICVVGFGNLKEEFKFIATHRKDSTEVLEYVE